MEKPTWTIRTSPIIPKGRLKLTAEENRIVVRELSNSHLNTLAALLQLGFSVAEQRGANYTLRHPSKGATVSLTVDCENLPKLSPEKLEALFKRSSPVKV